MGRVYQHELGRRHSINMHVTNRHLEKEKDAEPSDEGKVIIEVAPGEPVPPGMEGEVTRQAQIQEKLDGFKVGPLVALEYLIEMHDYDPSKEPFYLCILCDKRGDPRTVLTHLASYNHISQYLQKHFPTCFRALAPYMTKQYKRNWQLILQKIAEAIEKKYGRLKPFAIDQDKFEKDRIHYLTIISRGKHFSEQMGYNFIELVVHDELTKNHDEDGKPTKPATSWDGKTFIEKPFQKRSPSPPAVAPPTKKTRPLAAAVKKPPEVKKTPVEVPKRPGGPGANVRPPVRPFRGETRRSSLSSMSSISSDDEDSNKGRKFSRNKSPPPRTGNYRRRSPSPGRRPWERDVRKPTKDVEQQKMRIRERERQLKLEEYKKLCMAIDNDMEKTLKKHEKNPEKHPKYNDEWKLFWNRRYKELQSEGRDASKYDFKPEWIEFWGKKMLELHQEEAKNRKDALRKRLGLPEELQPISFRIGASGTVPTKPANKPVQAPPKENLPRPNLPMAARPDNDPEVILIDDKDEPTPPRDKRDNRSHSPWERESPPKGYVKNRRNVPSPQPRRGFKDPPKDARPKPSREISIEKPKPFVKEPIDRLRRSKSREFGRLSPKGFGRLSPKGFGRPSLKELRRSKSRELRRSRSRSREFRRSRSREIIPREKLKSPARSLSRNRRSRSSDSMGRRPFSREREIRDRERDIRDRERDIRDRDREIREREREIEKRDYRDNRGRRYSRERSWEKDRYRESSYERDLKGRERIRTVLDLPWEKEKIMYGRGGGDFDDYYGGPPKMRPKPMIVPPIVDDEEDNSEVNIVSVLRLLTALEERLGSLGPKIIDLLAQALAMEKQAPNSSESLLDNEINCVMFETVKEKLKGQLIAGLVDPIQERAFKKGIQKTASLIHIAGERKRNKAPLTGQSAVAVPGVGAVDKAAIAKQIANALIAQGKTDVTQDQLEQLINAVVGMAEASKASNKTITTASFLAQMAGGAPETPKEKVIIPRVHSSAEKKDKNSGIVDLDKLTEPLSPATPEKLSNNMENLSDSDLQTLLQNFKDLSTDEQMNLINYLKKLELDEPERVERLRKFVNLGSDKSKEITESEKDDPLSRKNGRESPFSNRLEGLNPDGEDQANKSDLKTIHLDSEDEDYSYEDVVKAASKNVKQQEAEGTRKILETSIGLNASKEPNLTDAKALISNLMSSFSGNVSSSGVNLLGLTTTTTMSSAASLTTPTSSADFVRNLGDINIDSLAKIVSSVQQNSAKAEKPKEVKADTPPEMIELTEDERPDQDLDSRNLPDSKGPPNFGRNPPSQGPFPNQPRPLLGQPPRGPPMQGFNPNRGGPPFSQQRHPRPMGPGGPNQGGYGNPNQRFGNPPRGVPPPGMYHGQRPQGGGNHNQGGGGGPRQGRPLLNLTFGAPRFRGPNPPPMGGAGPNYNRW
ncbi:uncharacterized protein CG7065-like isoform X2 [Sitophilus oryzae]|nr:uncharacterized protein CG7065-like isoform X2 [Sitophilus oryzae]